VFPNSAHYQSRAGLALFRTERRGDGRLMAFMFPIHAHCDEARCVPGPRFHIRHDRPRVRASAWRFVVVQALFPAFCANRRRSSDASVGSSASGALLGHKTLSQIRWREAESETRQGLV